MSTTSSLQSFLSSQKYGYDFVVGTTQASINSSLKEYLDQCSQPETYLCFLADSKGNPTEEISLVDLMAKTGGVNPFDIPNGTSYDDPRISTLTKNMFVVGLKIKMGLPSNILPKDLPPIVSLGDSADNVRFNLLCSEFEIIQNSPPSGFGSAGSWNVWTQPNNQSWYFSTTVNLVYKDLDQELDTPYFQNHPKEKQALIAQLKNISSSAFSLQQLLFDLDNAALQSIPTIQGLDPNTDAGTVLTKSFLDLYFGIVKNEGEPVISIHAISNTPDQSSLRLTGIEREVGQFVDGNGVPVQNPTPAQRDAYTLDYLCSVNNGALPGAATFNWNWVDPADIADESGMISINRNTLAAYYQTKLVPFVKNSCMKAYTHVTAHALGTVNNKWNLTPGQTPDTITIPESGATVLEISYSSDGKSHDKSGLTYGELDLKSSFNCTVQFSGNTITIVQHLVIYVKATFDLTSTDGNVVDRTITDTYTLSVDQNGNLKADLKSNTENKDKKIDLKGIITFFVDMNKMIDSITSYSKNISSANFKDIPASDIQSFIFPGGKVFVYKNVQFSEHQDLLTAITYSNPS